MKKVTAAIFGFLLFASTASAVESVKSETVKTSSEPVSAPAAPSLSSKQLKHLEDMRKLADEKKQELNGSEWKVKTGSSNPKAKGGEDVFTFQNNQIKSENLAKRGFIATNYTVTVEEGQDKGKETATFETMQTGPKGETIFIRGEWKDKSMQGTMNEQLEKDSISTWFTSLGREKIPPTSAAPKEEAESATPVPAPAPAVLTTTGKAEEKEKAVETFSGTTDTKRILRSK